MPVKRLICMVFICLILSGCTVHKQETVYSMNTVMDLQVWGPDAETAIKQIKTLITDLDRRWATTQGNSIPGCLNRGEDVILTSSEEALLDRVEALSLRTGGAFNPRLRSLSLAWGFYHEENQFSDFQLPTDEEITTAIAQGHWDLGAALKGYAGQEAASILGTLNIHRAMLNLGGNIQTYGEKPDGTPWSIGIQNPDGGDYIGVISVTGTMTVVTSGDYQRYFEADGVRYHHILDPETGYPANSGLRSVTVICSDGLTADCLSTALFVMGLEEGIEFWRNSRDFEAVFITTDGRILATEGADLSGCDYKVITYEE